MGGGFCNEAVGVIMENKGKAHLAPGVILMPSRGGG